MNRHQELFLTEIPWVKLEAEFFHPRELAYLGFVLRSDMSCACPGSIEGNKSNFGITGSCNILLAYLGFVLRCLWFVFVASLSLETKVIWVSMTTDFFHPMCFYLGFVLRYLWFFLETS
jgi:hypothetical protein